MDLANTRENGVVRSLAVQYLDCKCEAVVNMDSYRGDQIVKSFEARMSCSICGNRRVEVRPNWIEWPERGVLIGTNSRRA